MKEGYRPVDGFFWLISNRMGELLGIVLTVGHRAPKEWVVDCQQIEPPATRWVCLHSKKGRRFLSLLHRRGASRRILDEQEAYCFAC